MGARIAKSGANSPSSLSGAPSVAPDVRPRSSPAPIGTLITETTAAATSAPRIGSATGEPRAGYEDDTPGVGKALAVVGVCSVPRDEGCHSPRDAPKGAFLFSEGIRYPQARAMTTTSSRCQSMK